MEDLIIRVESSLVDLKNQYINITSLLTSSNHISHPSSISNPSHITAIITYTSLLTNSSPSKSSHNKYAHVPIPLTPSLVIENIDTSQRNLPFLKSKIFKLDLYLNTITTIYFIYNHAFHILSSPFIYDAIISSRNKLNKKAINKLKGISLTILDHNYMILYSQIVEYYCIHENKVWSRVINVYSIIVHRVINSDHVIIQRLIGNVNCITIFGYTSFMGEILYRVQGIF